MWYSIDIKRQTIYNETEKWAISANETGKCTFELCKVKNHISITGRGDEFMSVKVKVWGITRYFPVRRWRWNAAAMM